MLLRQSSRSLVLLLMFGTCVDAASEEPKRDRYGDPLPAGAVARIGSLRLRNEERMFAAAFTMEGKTLMAAGEGALSFWNVATGKLSRRVKLNNPVHPVLHQRLSADGKTLVQTLNNHHGFIYVVDAGNGSQQNALNRGPNSFILTLDLSRDGKVLAAVHQDSIVLWDVPHAKLLREFKGPLPDTLSPRGAVALTPDGKQLVLPHADGSLHLVDVASGEALCSFEMLPLQPGLPSSPRIQRLAVSPDGRYLVFGGIATPLTVCEMATGKRLHELAPAQGKTFSQMAFTPNGRVLAADGYRAIRLFDVPSGKEIRKLTMPANVLSQLLFSPDGRTLAVVGDHTVQFWDMTGKRWLHPFAGPEGTIDLLAFFPDDKRLVCYAYPGGIGVRNIASGQTLAQQMNTPAGSLIVDKDGESVRFANYSSVHHWDPRNGREEVQRREVAGLLTGKLALSPDGRSLAVEVRKAGGAGQKRPAPDELRLYDVKTNKCVQLPGLPPQGAVWQILFTPDSRRVAVNSHDWVHDKRWDCATRMWDRDTAKLVYESKIKNSPPLSPHRPLIFAADGRSYLTRNGGLLRICEIAARADRLPIPAAPKDLRAAAYAADGRFAACGQEDGRIFVYSTANGKQLARWQGNQGPIHSLAFNRDGRLLASGGANGTILIWKVPQDDSMPIVRNAEEAASMWQALGDGDAAAVNRALAGLTAAPALALPLLKECLPAIGKAPDRSQLTRWIAELDDDAFKVRDRASRELTAAGEDAADALRQALQHKPSPEAKRRIEDLLSRLKKGGYSQRLHFLRALEVLERIGSPQAKELLRDLAGKLLPNELREEVQASLRRMDDRR